MPEIYQDVVIKQFKPLLMYTTKDFFIILRCFHYVY